MTTDAQLAPTDDEIHAVVQACRERGLREFDVFRTVLAKLGTQPQPGAVDRTGCTAGTEEECTRRGCATSCPAQQAQPGAIYAELPAPTASIGVDDAWHEAAMRDFADHTHALRMQQVIIDFAQVGTAGPFPVVNGHVKLPGATMQDLARMLRPTYEAAPEVGNSGFDHKTAADFLNGKTISDEAVRKFVHASRRAHDEKAYLSAMLLSVRGELASRNAEIALLKRALMEAEAAPAPNLAKALNQKTLQNDSLHTRSEHDNT